MITRSGWKRRACSIASATVPGLGDDLEPLAPIEQRDEALADDLVVVDDEQPQRLRRRVGHACSRRSASVASAILGCIGRRGTIDDARARRRRAARSISVAAQRAARVAHVARAPGASRPRVRIDGRSRARCPMTTSSSVVVAHARARIVPASRSSGARRCSAPRARSAGAPPRRSAGRSAQVVGVDVELDVDERVAAGTRRRAPRGPRPGPPCRRAPGAARR